MLDQGDSIYASFVKVIPRDYKRVLEAIDRAERDGVDIAQAVMAAAHG